LNSLSRYATGMIAFISEQGMLFLGKMISMPSLSEKENVKLLLQEIATMVAVTNDL